MQFALVQDTHINTFTNTYFASDMGFFLSVVLPSSIKYGMYSDYEQSTDNAPNFCEIHTHTHTGTLAHWSTPVHCSLIPFFERLVILEHCGKLSSSGKNEIYDSILTMRSLALPPTLSFFSSSFFVCVYFCIVVHRIAIVPYYFLVV